MGSGINRGAGGSARFLKLSKPGFWNKNGGWISHPGQFQTKQIHQGQFNPGQASFH